MSSMFFLWEMGMLNKIRKRNEPTMQAMPIIAKALWKSGASAKNKTSTCKFTYIAARINTGESEKKITPKSKAVAITGTKGTGFKNC